MLPALLFCDERTSGLKIAALTALDRLVVAVHRAGAGPITVICRGQTPSLKRANALGIPVRIADSAPRIHEPTLVASTALLVHPGDVRELLRAGGRLLSIDGAPLPIGVLIDEFNDNRTYTVGATSLTRPSPLGGERVGSVELPLEQALSTLHAVRPKGVAHRVNDAASARLAERALWSSLTSASDGIVDKVFNRPCGRPLSKLLIHTPVTPNAVSVTSMCIGLLAAWFFAKGDQVSAIVAALLLQLSTIIDCVDGDIARVVFKESALGKWIDLVGDQVVHVCVFAAIALGLIRTEQTAVGHWLGLSTVIGAVLSFTVVVRGMNHRSENRSPLLQKLIDSTTNRDFSVLILILACFQSLEWFLWLSAIGTHVFWMLALSLQGSDWPKRTGAVQALWKAIALLAGLALFGWYLSRADLKSVWESLGRLGALAPVVLAPYLCVYMADCLGWRLTFPAGLRASYWTLFRIRWAGEAVNNVFPCAYIGGEAAKIYLLQKHGVSATAGTSSAVVSKTAQTLAQVSYIALASIAFMHIGGNRAALRAAMIVVLAAGVFVLAGLFWVQRRGIFGSLLALTNAVRLKLPALEHRREKILKVDQTITGFYQDHRPRFFASTAIYVVGWLLDTLELYLFAYLLGMAISWPQALAVEAFTSVAKVMGMWVPGALGVQESGIVMLGHLAGLPNQLSVAYALIRRAREVIFALIGWALLYAEQTSLFMLKAGATAASQDQSRK